MTQTELGAHLEVSAGAISSWERGSSPSIHKMRTLFEWLAEKPPARRNKQTVNAEFGKRIQKKRLLIGMSKTGLGKHLDIEKTLIRNWENGRYSPSKHYAEIVEKWLSEPADGILAQRIREKRAELSMTQKDLAAVLNVSLVTIILGESTETSLLEAFGSSNQMAIEGPSPP